MECSRDVQVVVFISNTPWPDGGYQEINSKGRASYRIMYEDRYVRIELIDGNRRRGISGGISLGCCYNQGFFQGITCNFCIYMERSNVVNRGFFASNCHLHIR